MSLSDLGSDHCRVAPVSEDADIPARLQFLRHLFAYAAALRWIPANACILEIGSGEGYGANYLAQHFQDVTAIDLSAQALRHATRAYPGVRFCTSAGTRLPFRTASFDTVVSFQVIEHILDTKSYLDEVCRVLKSSGYFILTTPNRQYRLLPLQKPWNPYHVREYSTNGLRRQLKRSFGAVEMFSVNASDMIMALEKARVRQRPGKVYGAPFRRLLKKIMPKKLWSWAQHIRRAQSAVLPIAEPTLAVSSAALQDFYLSTDPNVGLDLFAVASPSIQ